MASAIYNEYKKKISEISWVGASVKLMLVKSTYTLDIDAHSTLDDLNIGLIEVIGDGYARKTVTGKDITRDDALDVSNYTADNLTWENSTITARGAILYNDTGVASTSTLIAYLDFVGDKASNSGDFIIQWHNDGVFRLA